MQDANQISLNAVRVFLIAARCKSIKRAADTLKVTPGAVSHQVKLLEDRLGVALFRRRNNSIDLTDAGARLLDQALPGLHSIMVALDNVARDASEIRVQVPMSFATRWLIPRLGLFRQRNKAARIRVETVFDTDQPPSPEADVAITYYKAGAHPKDARILFNDTCRPYLSPALLAGIRDHNDLSSVPALQCAQNNWDWDMWLAGAGHGDTALNFTGHFDLDDAALRAAVTGLGMVLSPAFMVADEVADGRLCPLPGSKEITLGVYAVQTRDRNTLLIRRFVHWLETISQ